MTIEKAVLETFSLQMKLCCIEEGVEEGVAVVKVTTEHLMLTITIHQEELHLVMPKEFLAEFLVGLKEQYGICLDQYDAEQLDIIVGYLGNQLLVSPTLLRRQQVQIVGLRTEVSTVGKRTVTVCATVSTKKYFLQLIVGQHVHHRMIQYGRLVSLDDRQKTLLAHITCRFTVILELGINSFSTPGTVIPILNRKKTRVRFQALGSTKLGDSFGGKLFCGSRPGSLKITLEKSLHE